MIVAPSERQQPVIPSFIPVQPGDHVATFARSGEFGSDYVFVQRPGEPSATVYANNGFPVKQWRTYTITQKWADTALSPSGSNPMGMTVGEEAWLKREWENSAPLRAASK